MSSKTVFEKKCCKLDFENWMITIFFEHLFAFNGLQNYFMDFLLKNKLSVIRIEVFKLFKIISATE